jgi:peroxiredoxin
MPEGIWAFVFYALWAVLLLQTAMLVILSRHMRRLYREHGPDASAVGLALGAEVPDIEATAITGERILLGGPAQWQRLLVFLSPGCPGCRAAIREVQQVRLDGAQMILIWSMDQRKARDLADEYQIRVPMIADEDALLWRQFMISGVPFATVVDQRGRVAAKAFAGQAEQLEALLALREAGPPVEIDKTSTEPAPLTTR